jgi:hypothetical protein
MEHVRKAIGKRERLSVWIEKSEYAVARENLSEDDLGHIRWMHRQDLDKFGY